MSNEDTVYGHIFPLEDLMEHSLDPDGDCLCGPNVQILEKMGILVTIYTHHSLDGRELNE